MYLQQFDSTELKPCLPANMQKPMGACGTATVRLPAMELYQQCERAFVGRMLDKLWRGNASPEKMIRILEEAKLDKVSLGLDEFFGGSSAPVQELLVTSSGIRDLAAYGEEILSADGPVTDWKADLQYNGDEATVELERRIDQVMASVLAVHGDEAAAFILNSVKQTLEQHMAAIRGQIRDITTDEQVDIRRAVEELNGMADPRSPWHRFRFRFQPEMSATSWLEISETEELEEHAETISALTEKIYDRLRSQAMLDVWESIINAAIRRWFKEIKQRQAFRKQLRDLIDQAYPESDINANEHELLVVKSIWEPLSARSRLTFADLQDQKLLAAGCTPEKLAEKIWQSGVTIDHEELSPGVWFEHSPARISEAILDQHVRPYLGSDQLNKPIDLKHPQTALEHCLTITLRDSRLRPNVSTLLSRACDMSFPYVNLKRTDLLKFQIVGYLFCYPEDRSYWFERFKSQRTPQEKEAKSEFAINNPYEIVLVQYAYGAAGGCLPSFQRGMYISKQNQSGKVQRWMPSFEGPEFRWLRERPDDYLDCKRLFSALKLANEVKQGSAGSDGFFSPTVPEETIQHHFHQYHWESEWRTARFFQQSLRQSDFVNFVELAFAASPKFTVREDWQQFCSRLSEFSDPQDAAEQLLEQGILESMEGQRFRLAIHRPEDMPHIPSGLYKQTRGSLQGLSEEEFTGLLHRDDRFYNWAFWCVSDALAAKRLTTADVPEFMVYFLKANKIAPELDAANA